MEGRHGLLRRFGLIALVAVVVAIANRRRHRRRAAEPVASVAVTNASDTGIDTGIDTVAAEPEPPAPTTDLEQIERDLEGVAMALARLDDGTYWTDEVTGEPLVEELLVADPVARRNR